MISLGLEIAIIVFYTPITALDISFIIEFKDAVWSFLSLFGIVRIIGAALLIRARDAEASNIFIAVDILDYAGLSLLFLTALGFLGFVRRTGGNDNAAFSRVFFTAPTAPVSSSVAVLTLLAFSLSVAPVVKGEDDRWRPILEMGAILFPVIFVLIIIFYIFHAVRYRCNPSLGDSRSREVLFLSTVPLLFLAVRVTYHVFSIYSLGKFYAPTGSWQTYFGMSVMMEFIIVLLYNLLFFPVYLFYGSEL